MKTLNYAHRGFSAEYPENTLLAFEKALEAGCDGIELDVHLTKDHKLAVIHDFTLDRTTKNCGLVRSYTMDDLKGIHANYSFDQYEAKCHIPSLDEVFEMIHHFEKKNNKNIEVNIEIKAGNEFYPNIEESVIDCIKNHHRESLSIVSSFDHKSIFNIKNLDAKIITGVLIHAYMYNPWPYFKSLGVDYVHPDQQTLTPLSLKAYKENQYEINTYTVNDEVKMKQLIQANIRAIITNHPDILNRLL